MTTENLELVWGLVKNLALLYVLLAWLWDDIKKALEPKKILLLTIRESMSHIEHPRVERIVYRGSLANALHALEKTREHFCGNFPGQNISHTLLGVSEIEDPGNELLEQLCVEVIE